MKKMITMIILGTLIASAESIAQSCAPKGINTGMPSPVNPDPNGRINTFDYTATGWPLRTEYIAGDTWKQSPFYSDNNAAIQHLYAPNDGVLDILPANGWELIKRDFGYEDNGTQSPEKAKNPFLVLYNRYTAKLRIFVARYSQQNFNGANMIIKFSADSPMQTSLLDLSTEVKAIDATFIRDQPLNSVVNFPSGPYEWFYSDFQMSYDPCTCLFTSKLEIRLNLSNTASITLTGTSNGDIVSSGKPTATQNDKGPFSVGNFGSSSKKIAQAYKDGVKAKNDLQEAINKDGGSEQTTRTTGSNNLFNKLGTNSFLKAGLNSIPYVSAALSVVSLFTGGGKEGPQQVTITPMSIRQNYEYSGTLEYEYPDYTTITFRTPGSITGNSPLSQYPYYNEVMGVFNLIQTPKYKRTLASTGGGNYATTFTLSSDIEYVLNPAAKLNVQEIKIYLLILDQNADTKAYELSANSPSFTIPYMHGGPTPQAKRFMVILNLQRQNTNANTQNVLLSLQYPISLVTSISNPTAKFKIASNVDAFCNSTTYKNSARFPPSARAYEEAVMELEKKEWEEEIKKQKEAQETSETKSFYVYPNPGSTLVTIDYSLITESSVQLTMINSFGERTILENLSNVPAGSYSKDYNFSNLPEGMYYISLSINGKEEIQKMIIKR